MRTSLKGKQNKVLKQMGKHNRKTKKRDQTARIVADIHGVTPRYVRMVRNGDYDNDDIYATLMDYEQENSKLIQALKKLVPIQPNSKKYAR